jgi:hypothetical protein
MEEKSYRFVVEFRPKANWVDDVFLGNLLTEALGSLARSTGAFDFDVRKEESE